MVVNTMNTVEYEFHLIPKLEKESPTSKNDGTESPTPKNAPWKAMDFSGFQLFPGIHGLEKDPEAPAAVSTPPDAEPDAEPMPEMIPGWGIIHGEIPLYGYIYILIR